MEAKGGNNGIYLEMGLTDVSLTDSTRKMWFRWLGGVGRAAVDVRPFR